MALQPEFGQLVIRPKTVRADTPAQPGGDFVVVDAGSVARRHPDTYGDPATGPSVLLLSGRSLEALTVALVQAWSSGRQRESNEWRAGDTR
ncbi:hypothetical protein Srufu_051560 [Streptomyces libani subsp. rufus]|nr:hypothetical protein Srufu_051560 [Streptomyces libani subsp. rufus]